jgi:hypothetical protein
MTLETELQTFEARKAELLEKHQGKFALISGADFIGAFDTVDNAYKVGVDKFGLKPFLVKRISSREEEYRNQALSLGLTNASL